MTSQIRSGIPIVVGSGRVWVTRPGAFVDRMASAWLIRRFIDKHTRFKFVNAQKYKPQGDELRSTCSRRSTRTSARDDVQTLIDRFALGDSSLKGDRRSGPRHRLQALRPYGDEAEVAGVFAMCCTWHRKSTAADEDRLERSFQYSMTCIAFYGMRRWEVRCLRAAVRRAIRPHRSSPGCAAGTGRTGKPLRAGTPCARRSSSASTERSEPRRARVLQPRRAGERTRCHGDLSRDDSRRPIPIAREDGPGARGWVRMTGTFPESATVPRSAM